MSNYKVTGITPFVPAKDYALSCRFYKALGFNETVAIKNATRFDFEGFGFWVQDYYVQDLADNFMLCLYVEDLTAWSDRINAVDFVADYGDMARVHSQPHEQEGALMMQFIDPSGVLWHVRQDG